MQITIMFILKLKIVKTKNLFFALAVLSILFSCEKDKNNDPESSKNTHRINQVTYDDDGISEDWKSVFSYEGEKLVKITKYDKDESGNWIEENKTEIKYSGDNASETWYNKGTGNWELIGKSEYIIQKGLMVEESWFNFINGSWVELWKWTYQYSGSNISAWQSYNNENWDGTLVPKQKGEYKYQNEKLIEYIDYRLYVSDNWYPSFKDIFSYDGNNLSNYVGFVKIDTDTWEKMYKTDLLYSGDKVSQIDDYSWNDLSNQWEFQQSKSYTYNSNGYLIEKLEDDGDKTTYEYEEGHGNAKFFSYLPEELVYGEPTLKFASVNEIRNYIPYYQRLKTK